MTHLDQSVAYSYEPDTTVVDVDALSIARPRTVTDGALTMQVLLDGEYHRRTPDLGSTACERPIHSQFTPLRREELTGPLCETCFTPYERRLAAEANAKRNNGTR